MTVFRSRHYVYTALMIMNVLMRCVWPSNKLDEKRPSQAAIACLRTVMLNPAIAEHMLADMAVGDLKLQYPEVEPARPAKANTVGKADGFVKRG